MDTRDYFLILLSILPVIPAGILCLAPMKNHLRYDRKKVVIRLLLVIVVTLPLGALAGLYFHIHLNIVLMLILVINFFVYRRIVTASFVQALSVFFFVCVIISVFSNLAYAIDAVYHPDGSATTPCLVFGLYNLAFCTFGTILLFHLLSKYACFLIDHMQENRIWWITLPVSGLFLIANLYMTPLKYETLHVNNIFKVFVLLQFTIFTMELLLGTIFYHIVKSLLSLSDLRVKTNLMEMQERAYIKQQKYMEENSRIRHDFKHTIRSIQLMAEEGKLDELNRYLKEYVGSLPEKEINVYCKNSALNALLNHYRTEATSRQVEIDYRIELPPSNRTPLSNTEFCSMIGNILENSILAAAAQTEGKKYVTLTLHVEREKELYIVAVNSFDGNPLQKNGRYLSTRKKGGGIGLQSITAVVELHGGIANFHHEGKEFYTDIMIPLPPEQANPDEEEASAK